MISKIINNKKAILLLFFSLLAPCVYGQTIDSLKIKGLLNFNLSNRDLGRTIWLKPQIGFNAGMEVSYPLHKKWALKTQLLVSKRGVAFNFYHQVLHNNNLRINMFYVDLNILAEYRLMPKVKAFAGIGLDRMLFNHLKYTEPLPDGLAAAAIHYEDPAKMNLNGIVGWSYRLKPRWTANMYYSRCLFTFVGKGAFTYQFLSLGLLYDLK